MTDTINARERMRGVLEEAARVPSEMKLHADEHVDRIIDIVREALLETDSLEAAADIWNNHHAPTCDRAITAALDTAFPKQEKNNAD